MGESWARKSSVVGGLGHDIAGTLRYVECIDARSCKYLCKNDTHLVGVVEVACIGNRGICYDIALGIGEVWLLLFGCIPLVGSLDVVVESYIDGIEVTDSAIRSECVVRIKTTLANGIGKSEGLGIGSLATFPEETVALGREVDGISAIGCDVGESNNHLVHLGAII